MPFKAGADCFVKDIRTYPDGWTSGAWEDLMPKGARSLELIVQPNYPILKNKPLAANLEMLVWITGRGKVPVSTQNYRWTSNEPYTLHIDLPSEYYNSPYIISVRLQLSSCYTPRNLGLNTDARRLGVKVLNLDYQNYPQRL